MDVELPPHVQAEEVPDVCLEERAVQQEHWRLIVSLPVQKLERASVDGGAASERWRRVRNVDALASRSLHAQRKELFVGLAGGACHVRPARTRRRAAMLTA